MSKKQKQQKRLIRELEAALAQTLSDWAIERQENRSLREVIVNDRQRHEAIVDAMTNGMRRLTEERDAAEKDVAELLRDNEAADSTIRDLRKGLEVLGGVADMFERDLAAVQAQHYAVSEALDLEREYSAKTIGELRAEVEQMRKDWSGDVAAAQEIIARKTDENIKLRRDAADTISDLRGDLADTHERLDAALTEAARMRKEWANDASVAREIIERKSNEIVELRRTISELRGDLAKVRGDLERVTESWQHAEDLLQERERELDALRDQQAQQEHAEPVVTLQAIEELEEGERLIDEDGVIIESIPGGYEVRGAIFQAFKATPVDALQYYHEITGK